MTRRPDGRLALDWERTVIGGETAPRDFLARYEGASVGRIYFVHGSSTTPGHWSWTVNATIGNRGASRTGKASTKEEAAIAVEVGFTAFLEAMKKEPRQ